MYLKTNTMKKPRVNVLSQADFKKRVSLVFNELGDILGRSFGPYGAPTIISQYPYMHVTKDGYTIAKNLVYANDETNMDSSILRMAMDICGRLNNTVGDGTTTAIIATNAIYNAYQNGIQQNKDFLPRDIIRGFDIVKKRAIEQLHLRSTSIQSDDPSELRKNIEKVVYISSNGDRQYTNMIGELYEELKIPAITVMKSPEGITKATVTDGYQADVAVNDRLYLNNENGLMIEKNVDVLVFGTTITEEIYKTLIQPLWSITQGMLKRKLMIIANSYDTVALTKVIGRDINNEWNVTHNATLILTTIGTTSKFLKKSMGDLAALLNTTLITRELSNILCDAVIKNNEHILSLFNINQRNIPGIRVLLKSEDRTATVLSDGEHDQNPYEFNESFIRVGFVDEVEAGLKKSTFRGFHPDKLRIQKHLEEAKAELDEAINKYAMLATFNLEINACEKRYYALLQKMGTIEVGADTELDQTMTMDAVDDAVKASASAFNNGVILGCNVTLLRSLYAMLNKALEDGDADSVIFANKIMLLGFMHVQKKVLTNAYPKKPGIDYSFTESFDSRLFQEFFHVDPITLFGDVDHMMGVVKMAQTISATLGISLDYYDLLVVGSIYKDQVFDVTTRMYSRDIINSTETDSEVVKATSDLISMLISGNQMVLTLYGRQ